MKKQYYRPEIRKYSLVAEHLLTTDSKGLLNADNICTREEKYFDEDNDNDSKKSFWDE